MLVKETTIDGVKEIIAPVFNDDRGWFMEFSKRSALEKAGIQGDFLQDNLSWSRKGVIRGLHLQRSPFAQAKLVTVLAGRVLDVAVDLRKESPPTLSMWRWNCPLNNTTCCSSLRVSPMALR